MGQTFNNLYMLGRLKDTTNYTPFLVKIAPSTMTVSDMIVNNNANTYGTSATIFYARLGVCETLGYYIFANNKDGLTTNIQLTIG